MMPKQPKKALAALLLLLVVCLPGNVPAAESPSGIAVEDWTYSSSSRPLSSRYADPGGRLSDGEHGRDKTVILRGDNVEITIQLNAPHRLSAVRIHQHRHNLNYRLTRLEVLCRSGGHWQEEARLSKGFVGPTPSMDFVHVLSLGGVETDAVMLRFVGANVLSVSEIDLFAEDTAASAVANRPFSQVPNRSLNAPIARTEDLDGDGAAEVIVENRFVRLVLTPARGGICQSLWLKSTETELVGTEHRDYGLFRDQLWKPRYSFADRVYFHRLLNSDGGAGVELWATGSGGMMSFTEIRKTITIERDSPLIKVHYKLTNQPSSQTRYEYGMWFHNWLGDAGAEHNTYVFPTVEGVKTFTLEPTGEDRGGDMWYRNVARGWTAVRSAEGNGLAITMPFAFLNLFYHWHGTGSRTATHEWRFNLLECAPGDSIEADLLIIPFQEMPRIDGVVNDVVGAVLRDDDQITAELQVPPHSRIQRAVLRLLSLDRAQTLALASADLSAGQRNRIRVNAGTTEEFIAQVQLYRDGQSTGDFERCFGSASALAGYRLAPAGPQEGRKEDTGPALEEYRLRTDVVTPHIPWATPLPDGPIRALVLMDDMNCREAVELAQRVDMELDYVKFRTTLAEELIWQGDRSIETLAQAQDRLEKRLAERSYDVLIVAGFDWHAHFTRGIHEAVIQRVREGMGLILIQPDGFTLADVEVLPIAGVPKEGNAARSMYRWFPWQSAADHPLTSGLDWTRFPVTRRHEYNVPPQGTVVATIGEDRAPLLTLGTLGDGRVISATWDTLTHAMSYRGYSALTPILSYRGAWLRPEFADLPRGYQEWWFALLCRMTTWAAGRAAAFHLSEAPSVEGVIDPPPAVTVTVQAQRALDAGRIDLIWHNTIGEQAHDRMVDVRLTRGANTLTFTPPRNSLTGGTNTLCVVLRDRHGASLTWGFTSVNIEASNRLASYAVEPDTLLPEGGVWQDDVPIQTRAFRPRRPLTLRAELGAPADVPLDVNVDLTDTGGRLLGRLHQMIPAGAGAVTFEWHPQQLVHQGIEAAISLSRNGVLLDRKTARAVAYQPRVWDRFWFTSWGGQYLWRTKYLFDFNSRMVRDIGVDVSFGGISQLSNGKVRDNAYWDINHSWLDLLGYLGKDVPDFMDRTFGRKATAYAKTQDKAYLVRTPSLVDPEWRQHVRKVLLERVSSTIDMGGAFDYCMGDEMSLTHYTKFHDYDWSEHSLIDFRGWLQHRYPDLAALNKSWDSSFTSWDDVLPMTREEARKTDNPAAWCEFRIYMNHQLADFYRFVRDTIRSVDPQARCGLSGTQSPEAANGMDWWLLSDAFTYYHSYNTSWSNEMRRSFQRFGRPVEQSPYYSGYNAVDPDCERRMWWCLFHDTRGISCWKTGLFFYGDFTRTPSGVDTSRHLNEFRGGIWRLIRGARRRHDRIAIHVSMPTIIAGALTGESSAINAYRDAWVKLMEDCGLQYEFVAHEQVAEGILNTDQLDVLVLPHALALAPEEAEAIRRFVRDGGTILATVQPGRRDDLGRPQSPALLDDLFGISTEGSQRAVEPGLVFPGGYAGLDPAEPIRMPPAMTTIVARNAEAKGTADAGKVPILTHGSNGKAILLNIDLLHVEQERRFHSPAEEALRRILLAELQRAGISPRYPITLASGRPAHLETVVYEAENVIFLCLLNDGNDRDIAKIALPQEHYVYDVRAGQYLGAQKSLQIPLEPGAARVFALCQTELSAPVLKVDAEAQIGKAVDMQVALPAQKQTEPQRRLLRLEVRDAEGRERREYMQTIWVQRTPVHTALPLALNDTTGEWQIIAYDLISGKEATAVVVVK